VNSPGRLLAQLPSVYHASKDLQALLAALETILFGTADPELSEDDMRAVGEALQARGYKPGVIDGTANDETRAAIRAFQRDNRLSITGEVDQKTADRLGVTITDPALERKIARMHTYFDPFLTPVEFLPWLGQWVALSHGLGLTEKQQRRLVGTIVPLYAWRGTKRYLIELLKFYLPPGADARVDDQEFSGFRIGVAALGMDTWLERDRPFWFKVTIRLADTARAAEERPLGRNEWQEQLQQVVRRVIELAKPAHTSYDLDWAWAEENSDSIDV
jgi:phage tail-like protein